ncbi:MAG: hypothetical protein GX638_10150, partial [Crenarchaeota archaeon]|nr:hypothetical protein [Thermoproteota archaeon]
NIEDDKKAELESLFKWMKKSTCNKYAISIIVFIEILRIHPFFDGNGRMSRLWLRIMLTNIDNQLSNISFEKEFFDNRTFYSNIISSHKDQEDLTLFIEVMLLKLLALKANHQEKVDTSDLEAYGRKGFNDWYSDEYISRAMESQVVKDLFQNIQTLGKNSDLEEEEKQKLKADLLGISIANYMEYDELITINSILRDHHLGEKIDLLYLLSLVIEGRNQFHRFEKRKADWLSMQDITEVRQKKNKELKNELHAFQCCCLNAHNLNIKNHYKGNGPGSGRSILLKECEFLKEKFNETPHKFNKLCRDFESKLPKNQASEILNSSEYCCPIYSSSEDDKKNKVMCGFCQTHELI